jgi:hypothetical protein
MTKFEIYKRQAEEAKKGIASLPRHIRETAIPPKPYVRKYYD